MGITGSLLLEFRDNIEEEHKKSASDIGLNETEYAFHNILMKEISEQSENNINEETHQRIIEVVKSLVEMMSVQPILLSSSQNKMK